MRRFPALRWAAALVVWGSVLAPTAEAADVPPLNAEAIDAREVKVLQAGPVPSQELRQKEAMPEWRLDTGYSTSRFARVYRKDWHEGYFNIARRIDDATLSVRIEQAKRYGLEDTYIRLGLDYRFADGLNGYIRAGATPNADFLPRRTIEAGGSLRLWDGIGWIGATVATLDLKQKDYATGDTRSIDPGLSQYFFKGRLWLTGRRIFGHDVASGKWHPGWLGQVDMQVSDTLRLFAGTSDTGESEQGATADTLTRFAGLAADISPRFGANLSYTRDNRKHSYIRNVYAVGVTIRF